MVSGILRGTDTSFVGPICKDPPKSPLKKEDEDELEAKLSPLNAPAKFKLIVIDMATIFRSYSLSLNQNDSHREESVHWATLSYSSRRNYHLTQH